MQLYHVPTFVLFFAKKKDNSNGCVTRGGRKAFGMLWKYSLAKTALDSII